MEEKLHIEQLDSFMEKEAHSQSWEPVCMPQTSKFKSPNRLSKHTANTLTCRLFHLFVNLSLTHELCDCSQCQKSQGHSFSRLKNEQGTQLLLRKEC